MSLVFNTHIAPYGTKLKSFEAVAERLNNKIDFETVVDAKSMRDCYKVLQKISNSNDKRDAMHSVLGGDVIAQKTSVADARS